MASPRAQSLWQPEQELAPREGAALTYDPVRDRVVLFGGRTWIDGTLAIDLDDLFEWDGSTWTARLPRDRPPARAKAGLAFDPGRPPRAERRRIAARDPRLTELAEHRGDPIGLADLGILLEELRGEHLDAHEALERSPCAARQGAEQRPGRDPARRRRRKP